MNRTAFSLPAHSEYRTQGGLEVSRSVEQFTGGAERLDHLIDLLDRRRGVVLSSGTTVPGRYESFDLGFSDPPLVLETSGSGFSLQALNARGENRAGDGGNLVIDIRGIDGKRRTFGQKVADLLKEGLLRGRVDGLPPPRSVPFVDMRLQSIPFPQQRAIDGAEAIKKAIEPLPKRRRLDPEAGKHFINDEIVKDLSYLEIGNSNALNVRHSNICPLMVLCVKGVRISTLSSHGT